MARIAATSLTRFELTEFEQQSGQLLNIQNKQVIQNLIADYSEEKLQLNFDPEHVMHFAQAEAELKGKINILQYLLDLSTQTEQEKLQEAQLDASRQHGDS